MPKHQTAASRPQRPHRARTLWTPLPATLAALGLLLVLPGGVLSAQAATPIPTKAPPLADQDVATADLVQRLVLDRAASLARVQKKADEREQQLLDQLENKDRTLRRALKEAQAGGVQTAQWRKDLAGVMAERTRLVEELMRRDAVFKGELAEYRRLIAELANSPNPERRQALERYADGDRVGAFATLKELTRIEEAAGEKAVKLRAAARYREQAVLAADMKDRGDPGVSTLTVLAEWEAAAERNPEHFETWIFIAWLRQTGGQMRAALDAAERAQTLAGDTHELTWAASALGSLRIIAGDLAGARRSFEVCLQIFQQMSDANSASAETQREVSNNLMRLGSVLEAAGDALGASRFFGKNLEIASRLAKACTESPEMQQNVLAALTKLVDTKVSSLRQFDVLREIQIVKDRGALTPSDARLFEEIKQKAAAQKPEVTW